MLISRRSFLVLAIAFAGLLAATSPAHAFWPYIYRQRVVIRGGGPFVTPAFGFVGAPVRGVGVTGELFPLSFGVGEFAPLGESYFLRDSRADLKETIRSVVSETYRQESARVAAEAGRISPGSGGTQPAGGTTTSCQGLTGRLEKIEDRLGKLSDRVKAIEDKVDALLAEKQAEQHAQVIARIVDSRIRAQNAKLVPLFRELLKKEPDKAVIEDLLKKLDQ